MAYTLPVRMVAKIIDGQNIEGLATAYAMADPTSSLNNLVALWTTLLGDIDAVSDGQIVNAWITAIPVLPTTIKSAPTSASRVEQTGVFNFQATGVTNKNGVAIPALSNSSTVISGGKIVITPGSPADHLIQFLQTGTSTLEWSNPNNQPGLTFKSCLIAFRKHNEQLAAATFTTVNN